MTRSEMIEVLKEKSERLQKILAEPEPGLGTWNVMLGQILDEVAAFAPSYVSRDGT